MVSTNRMRDGYILLFWVFPVFLEGCCEKHKQRDKGPFINMREQHYRVVEGEMFVMPCTNKEVTKYEMRENGGLYFHCGREFLTKVEHSGNYTLVNGRMSLQLQVLEKQRYPCYNTKEENVELLAGAGGTIPCPGFNCSLGASVTWYKGNKSVSEQRRTSCVENGDLHLCPVRHVDTGRFFCDQHFTEQGIHWILKRPVTVMAKLYENPPRITKPIDNTTDEVELGKPHTLTCEVHFPFEVKFPPQVRWYVNHREDGDNRTLFHSENPHVERVEYSICKVTHNIFIQEVTALHLKNTYTCMAKNSFGKHSVTIKLKRKVHEKWLLLFVYPIASLALVAGMAIVLHVKWLELKLIYITRFQRGKADADEKEFDVFLSYVWTRPQLSLSGQGPSQELSDYSSISDLRPPEVMIPMVLEDLWGYRLCLLERDMLPGEAYTNDVVRAIRRSQILICVVSAEYLANSNAVFVLESGIKVLLQSSPLRILLIWMNRTSAFSLEADSPLPSVVQRALKVLPSLDWKSGHSARVSSKFWRSLRKALPKPRVTSQNI
ncbi:interleukin-18 receptor accessory protein-like isoform X1 [Corythoichthys intestinalis]|uniref:interleukin-18 receptor accessory protein-like isoform X1 n=1 Tax=Corythoichthys intestinalis TaxID=161448 RepID=UPI0025A655B8|nr:interleukin-18 receptor accessory protein-like isoform X1 [Corythoichthys intestinalis]